MQSQRNPFPKEVPLRCDHCGNHEPTGMDEHGIAMCDGCLRHWKGYNEGLESAYIHALEDVLAAARQELSERTIQGVIDGRMTSGWVVG